MTDAMTVRTSGYDYTREGDEWYRLTYDGSPAAAVRQYAGEEMLCILDALLAAQQRAQALWKERDCMVKVAWEAYEHWDADRDSKVGKLLAALGGTRGIRVDLDAARPEAPHV